MISEQLIQSCRKMHREAQRVMYDELAPQLYRVCKRYLKREEDIEDVLADAFCVIFTKLDQLRDDDLFEAWARKTAVNLCLRHLRDNVNFNIYIEDSGNGSVSGNKSDTSVREEDLMRLLDYLPAGCRTIFNLYAIEGYNHREIAEQLNISTGTSKSQLNAARTKLQQLVGTHYYKQAR